MRLDDPTGVYNTAIPISTDSITAQPRTLFPGLHPTKGIEDMTTVHTFAAHNRGRKNALIRSE